MSNTSPAQFLNTGLKNLENNPGEYLGQSTFWVSKLLGLGSQSFSTTKTKYPYG